MEHMSIDDMNTLIDLLNEFSWEVKGRDLMDTLNLRDLVEEVKSGEYNA